MHSSVMNQSPIRARETDSSLLFRVLGLAHGLESRLEAGLAAVDRLGLESAMWDNGSPEPDDWAWEPGR